MAKQLTQQTSKNFDSYLASNKEVQAFLDSIYVNSHSQNSVNSYRNSLKHVCCFLDQQYHYSLTDLIAKIKSKKIDSFRILNEFVIYLDKQGKNPSTIRTCLQAIKGFLWHCGIKIYAEDFKQSVKIPKKIRQREEPLTKEIIVRLLHVIPLKLQTAILVATASGLRIGELVQLRISDIDFESKPTRIKVRADITKTKEARETYLTSEATIALKDYLKRFFAWKEGENNQKLGDKIVFGRTSLSMAGNDTKRNQGMKLKKGESLKSTPVAIAESVLINSLNSYINSIPELSTLNENGRKVIHFHAFRKFFRTVVGDAVGRDYAEAVIGHHFYMDTYYNLPSEKRRKMYLQAEPYLTISDFTKVEKNLGEIAEKYRELEAKYNQLDRQISKSGKEDFTKAKILLENKVEYN